MASVNKVILIGNLGADPEVRTTGTGKSVAEIRIATTSKFGETEQTEWHRVVLWEKLADVAAKYLAKGKPVYIEGRIQTRTYEDKDGVTRYITEVVANNMQLLGSRGNGDAAVAEDEPEPAPKARKSRAKKPAEQDDDLPF